MVSESVWTIVVAAGSGSRFGGEVPKQYVGIAGRPVLEWAVSTALAAGDGAVVVLPRDYGLDAIAIIGEAYGVAGGATRSESVRAGLAAVPDSADIIVVHDAARPAALPELFDRVIHAVRSGADAAIPVVPVVDTLRHRDGSSVDRNQIEIVQTPQAFRAQALRRAHAGAAEATDDATLVAAAGGRVETVAGDRWNIKLTDVADRAVLAAVLGGQTRGARTP